MDLIYQNGYCNIAASSATNDSEGLFFERDPLSISPYRINRDQGEILLLPEGFWQFREFERTELNARGWVFQERMLARRNISFTRDMIFFECAEEFSSEVADSSKPLTLCQSNQRGNRYPYLSRAFIASSSQGPYSLRTLSRGQAHAVWWSLIETYSKTRLTFSSDRLVALTGIAKWFQKTVPGKYLAGLWGNNLTADLAWTADGLVQVIELSEYIAPSWSWASIAGGIYYPQTLQYPRFDLVEIIDAATTPQSHNTVGSVGDGRIRLRGWIFPILVDADTPNDGYEREKDQVQLALRRFELNGNICLDPPRLHSSLTREELMVNNFYGVPLLYNSNIPGYKYGIRILLLAAVTQSRGVYQRVGIATTVYEYLAGSSGREPRNWDHVELPERMGDQTGGPPRDNFPALYALAAMIKELEDYDVPSHERADDRRHTITLV